MKTLDDVVASWENVDIMTVNVGDYVSGWYQDSTMRAQGVDPMQFSGYVSQSCYTLVCGTIYLRHPSDREGHPTHKNLRIITHTPVKKPFPWDDALVVTDGEQVWIRRLFPSMRICGWCPVKWVTGVSSYKLVTQEDLERVEGLRVLLSGEDLG